LATKCLKASASHSIDFELTSVWVSCRSAHASDATTDNEETFTARDRAIFVHRDSKGKEQFDRVMAAVRASPDLPAFGKDGHGEDRFTSRDMKPKSCASRMATSQH